MKSKQAAPTSAPIPVKLAAGVKLVAPMASGRITPTAKTQAKMCCAPSASGSFGYRG